MQKRKIGLYTLGALITSHVWASIKETQRYELNHSNYAIRSVILNPRHLIWQDDTAGITLMALPSQRTTAFGSIFDFATMSPSGDNLIFASKDRLSYYDLDKSVWISEAKSNELPSLDSFRPLLSFSPAEDRVLLGDSEGHLASWDLKSSEIATFSSKQELAQALFCEDSEHIATVSVNKKVEIFQSVLDPNAGAKFVSLRSYELAAGRDKVQKWPETLSFSKNGASLFYLLNSGKPRLIHVLSGKDIDLKIGKERFRLGSLSEDGEFLFMIADNGIGGVWQTSDGSLLKSAGDNHEMRFSLEPDVIVLSEVAEMVAVISLGEGAQVWSWKSGKMQSFLPEGAIKSAKFSNDGRTIFTADDQGLVQVWAIDEI